MDQAKQKSATVMPVQDPLHVAIAEDRLVAEPEAARESYRERTVGNVDQCGQPSPGLLAPCLGLALVAGAAL